MTKYMKESDISNKTILELGCAVKKGKIVIFKTDTVYAIGTNAFTNLLAKKLMRQKKNITKTTLYVTIGFINVK